MSKLLIHAANNRLEMGDVEEAIKLYTKALESFENEASTNSFAIDIRARRSEAFFLQKQYHEAFDDALVVMEHDLNNIRNIERAAQCCLFLGSTNIGKLCLSKIPNGENRDQELKSLSDRFKQLEELKEKILKHYEVKDFLCILGLTDEAIAIAPSATFFIEMKAKSLFYLKKNIRDLLNGIDSNQASDYALGLCCYCEQKLDAAIHFFQKASKYITEATMWLERVSFLKKAHLTKNDLQKFGAGQPGGDVFNENPDLIPTVLKNRAASRMIEEKYKEALEDITEVLTLVPSDQEAIVKAVQCYMALGSLKEATDMLNLYIREPVIRNTYAERLEKVEEQHVFILDLMNNDLYDKAIEQITIARKDYPKNWTLILLQAEWQAMNMKIPHAEDLLHALINDGFSGNAHYLFVRGLCYYNKNRLKDAHKNFSNAKSIAQENELQFSRVLTKAASFELKTKAMIDVLENAEEEKKRGNKQTALSLYTSALSFDKTNLKFLLQVHLYRAEVYGDIGKYKAAVYDYEKAIEIEPDCSDAWSGKGNVHMKMGNFKAAVDDFAEAFKLSGTRGNRAKTQENRENWNRAKRLLKNGGKQNHYDILGIGQNATEDQIRNAYHSKAKEFHPDKNMNVGEEERQRIEAVMKNVTAAQRCLSDPVEKRRYDRSLEDEEGEGTSSSYGRRGTWYQEEEEYNDDGYSRRGYWH